MLALTSLQGKSLSSDLFDTVCDLTVILCIYQLSRSVKHNGNECRFVVVLLVMQVGPDWKCEGNCDSALVNTAHTSGTKAGRPHMMQQRVLACIFMKPNGVLVVDTCVAAAVPESFSARQGFNSVGRRSCEVIGPP